MTTSGATLQVEPVRAPEQFAQHHPSLGTVLRRLAVSLAVACVVPAALFYVALVSFDVTAAVIAALTWSYSAILWRWATKRRTSGLLMLTVAILTIRTAITLSTGDTFIYFLQPVVSDGLVALVFFGSLATTTPVVARLAADFYPMDLEMAARPRIRRLLWHLTLLWGGVGLVKGGVGYWLLQSQSLVDFVLIKNLVVVSLTVCAVAVTVHASTCVARREGLMDTPARRGS